MVNIIKKTLATLLMAGALTGAAGCAGPRKVVNPFYPFQEIGRAVTGSNQPVRKKTDEEIRAEVEAEWREAQLRAKNRFAQEAARSPPTDYRVGEYLQQNNIPILRSMSDYDAFVKSARDKPVVLLAYGRFEKESAAQSKDFVRKKGQFGSKVIFAALADDAEGLAGIVGLLPTRNGTGIIVVHGGKIQAAKPYESIDSAITPYLVKK